MLKWRKPARTMPPNSAPTMPTMMSQKSPRPWPSARWLARNPATRPTSAQTRIWSRSRVTGVPLTEMTIAVEGGVGVDHVGQRLDRRPHLQGQHQLAEDLARPRRHQRRADEHAPRAVGDQLQHSAVKVVDVAARRLTRVGLDD